MNSFVRLNDNKKYYRGCSSKKNPDIYFRISNMLNSFDLYLLIEVKTNKNKNIFT